MIIFNFLHYYICLVSISFTFKVQDMADKHSVSSLHLISKATLAHDIKEALIDLVKTRCPLFSKSRNAHLLGGPGSSNIAL